jgi:hypothetical protein
MFRYVAVGHPSDCYYGSIYAGLFKTIEEAQNIALWDGDYSEGGHVIDAHTGEIVWRIDDDWEKV